MPIRKSNAILIGISAGAINLANDAFVVKEEDDDIYENYLYKGIGIVDINIEPHFDINNLKHLEEIKIASNINEIVCLPNYSYIKMKNNDLSFIGKYYVFHLGKIIREGKEHE